MNITHPLIHYSSNKITDLEDREYDQSGFLQLKPHGLWVSIEDGNGWANWCNDEEIFQDRIINKHQVTLASDHNILFFSPESCDEICEKYGYPINPETVSKFQFIYLNWQLVARDYQGFFIPDYRRLMSPFCFWSAWDCSSGCIWDLDAIESFEPLDS